eukprot:TRINITY_DN6783_c0_g1_i1.p1 TRINITY_DN6783_c0_g1~~TRINITY_DN6783_c0_g1_i1.p1  ORF type:complete len:199 (-),score=56.13 TRINITY_DN6783_c0_g1_i1:258-854(-)
MSDRALFLLFLVAVQFVAVFMAESNRMMVVDDESAEKNWKEDLKHYMKVGANETCKKVPAGYAPGNCTWYDRNAWWLPSNYKSNAQCVCSNNPPLNETFACVRRIVQEIPEAFPLSFKQKMAQMKNSSNPIQYQTFLQQNFTPLVYKAHVDAYKICCCPSGPAPYITWVGITLVPLPCPFVWNGVLFAGSCHGTPGKW